MDIYAVKADFDAFLVTHEEPDDVSKAFFNFAQATPPALRACKIARS